MKKEGKKLNRQSRILVFVLLFSICVTGVIAAVIGIETEGYLTSEINQKIVNNAEKSANKVESQLNHMTGLVDAIVANVISDYDSEKVNKGESDRQINSFLDREGVFLENSLKVSTHAHSLYIVMNPDITDEPAERWFSIDSKGKIRQLFVNPGKKKIDFGDENDPAMQYYFKARDRKNSGVWTGMYFDDDINEKVMSYSRAIYIDNEFVGVAGADIVATETDDLIRNIRLYDGGTAAMFDGEYGYVIKPDMDAKAARQLQEAIKREANGRSGLFTYTSGNQEYVAGFARMENQGTVAIVQPSKEAYASVSSAKAIVLCIAALIGLILLVFMYFYLKYFMDREEMLERESRQKDIMLDYEARRARVGEMVGNVAHQWKQPLHTINLILANLLDSYRYDEFDEYTLKNSVKKVEKITGKMSETISDFSSFMKPVEETMVDFNLVDCIDAALSLMEENLAKNRVEVIMANKEETIVHGYPNELRHALFNVLDNAREAIVESRANNRRIIITMEHGDGNVYLRITDNGSGMPEYVEAKVFEPYFTTKQKDGTGLGLYIAKNAIEKRMGGRISLSNIEDGACCLIILKEQTDTSHSQD